MTSDNPHAPPADPASPGRRRVLALLGALGAAAWAGASAKSQGTERFGIVGQRAPTIEGSYWIDADGEPTRFAMREIEARWVYLKCFQSWCPGCHRHGFPALASVSEAFAGDERVAFIALQTVFEGFDVNTRDKLRGIQDRYSLRMKMGHDAGPGRAVGEHGGGSSTMRRYRTGGTPWVVLIDPAGRVVYNGFNPDPGRVTGYLRGQLTA